MAKKNHLNPTIHKPSFKKAEGKCRLCGEDIYALLDVHRILPGCEGGRYTKLNSVTCCSNCHRKVHDKLITIDRYYLSSSGQNLLRIVVDGEEKFV